MDLASRQPVFNPCSNLFKIYFCLPCYLYGQGTELLKYASDIFIIGILYYSNLYSICSIARPGPICMRNFVFNILLFGVSFPFHTLSCYFSVFPSPPRPPALCRKLNLGLVFSSVKLE